MPRLVPKPVDVEIEANLKHNFDELPPDGSSAFEYEDMDEFVRARRAAGMWARRYGFKIATRTVSGKGYIWRVQ